MSMRTLEINGRKVSVLEDGVGDATLYLHGFADVHGVTEGWMPFHEKLLEGCRLYAPAHPGCATSDEIEYLESVGDLVFHYLEVIDALGSSGSTWWARVSGAGWPRSLRRGIRRRSAGSCSSTPPACSCPAPPSATSS